MIRTYYVELEGTKIVIGEAWVEVEEVLNPDGSVNEDATEEAAMQSAYEDVDHHKIDWEIFNGDVDNVEITDINRD